MTRKTLAVVVAAIAAMTAAGVWWLKPDGVESALLAEEPYRILKKYERESYSRLLGVYREFRSGARAETDFVRESNALFSEVATRRLRSASQESVQALMHDTVRTVKKLRDKSPEACFRYLHADVAGAPDVSQILSAEEQRHTLGLMGEVVRSSAENPVARPSQAEIERPLADIINATYEQYGTDAQMAAHPDDPRIDRAKVCVITTSLYERILALPPDVGTKLIRYMAPAP